ncbi:MAG: hypothetical protein AAF108_10185 [Planctomycetota bacterium]
MHADRTTTVLLLAAAMLGGCASRGGTDEPASEPVSAETEPAETATGTPLPADELTNPGPTALFTPVDGWAGTGVDLKADGFVAVFNTANPADIQVLNTEGAGTVRWVADDETDQVMVSIAGPNGSNLSFSFTIAGDTLSPADLEGITDAELTLRERP